MSILNAHNLSQSFGADDLFEQIDLRVEAKERIGIVGPNGCGKTTLLQILAGVQEPTRGEVMWQKGLSVGYLQQEAVLTFRGQENTIYAEMMTVFAEVQALEAEMRAVETAMAAGDYSAELLARYGQLQEQHELAGGYHYSAEIKLTLIGLGFPEGTWQTALNHLSGGQKTRVLLARMLLEAPDLLILDEPTNHLDLDAIEWLENRLRKWQGALIVVSHDRYFLDRVVDTIAELTATNLAIYRGDYAHFVTVKAQEEARAEQLFAAAKQRLNKELDFIRQHVADGQADSARGRLRRVTREIVLLERFPVTEIEGKSWLEIGGRVRTFSANEAAKRLRKLQQITNRPKMMHIQLPATEAPDEIILRGRDLRFGYAGEVIVSAERLQVERGNRIAIIGKNGSGKSTLLKGLLGQLDTAFSAEAQLLGGEIEIGDELTIGYFAQAHDQLDPNKKIIAEVQATKAISEQEARSWLARFQFTGHDVFKLVRDLSGGERGRLALALLALKGANLLLLDEPTNHLDIPSQEVLQIALSSYDGTIIFVSHDRYLVRQLANQVWDLRGGVLHIYNDGYSNYLERRAIDLENAELGQAPSKSVGEAAIDELLAFQAGYAEEVAQKAQPDWRQQIGQLEALLDSAENELAQLQARLANGEDVAQQLQEAEIALAELSAEWDALMG